MKVSNSTANALSNQKAHSAYSRYKCPFPLVATELTKEELDLKKRSKFELRSDPTDPNSLKYTVMVTHIDGSEDPRTVIQWKKEIEAVRKGSGLTRVDAIAKMVTSTLAGSAQDAYIAAIGEFREGRKATAETWKKSNILVDQEEEEHDEDFAIRKAAWQKKYDALADLRMTDHTAALQAVIVDAMPYKAITKQKRYMRRFMKKPPNMRFRTYVAHINKINKEEIMELPPFNGLAQTLKKDDLVDIMLNGMPTAWEDEMDKHDFDPEANSIQELVDFCERLEAVEQRHKSSNNNNNQNQNGNSQSGSRKKAKTNGNSHGSKKSSTGKWCTFHEKDTHDTSECRQKQFHGKNSDGSPKKADKSKSYNNKSKDNNQYISKKELNALMKKFTTEAVKEWSKTNNKKRSAAEANMTEVTTSDDSEMSYKASSPEMADDTSSLSASSANTTENSVESTNDKDDVETNLLEILDDDAVTYDVTKEQFMLETKGKQPSA